MGFRRLPELLCGGASAGRCLSFGLLHQFAADDFDAVADKAYDVRRVDVDVAAVDHHVDGVLERFPEFVGFVDVFVAELCSRAEDRLVEVLEKFLEERVRWNADANFRALDIELAGDVRVGGQNECVRAGHALLDDVEREVAHMGVAACKSDVGDDERHEELFHGLLEGVKLVDRLRGFGVATDGVAGFGGVEDKSIVFKNFGRLLDDSGLRIFWMYFESHIFFVCVFFAFGEKIYKKSLTSFCA